MAITINGRVEVHEIWAGSLTPPSGLIENADFDDGLQADKFWNRNDASAVVQGTVADADKILKVCRGAVVLESIVVSCITLPTGDYGFDFDILKASSGGAFVSVLNEPIRFDSQTPSSLLTINHYYVPTTTSINAMATIKSSITTFGSSGTQGANFFYSLWYKESPVRGVGW